jgi:hypothetical protein
VVLPPPPALDAPALTVKDPPGSDVEGPTVTEISPPSPLAALPVPMDMEPDEPQEVVPELKTKAPLIPPVPASGVRIVISPELLAVPIPDNTDT